MPRESVVDALNTIHRALRPGGILLDVHPTDVPSSVASVIAGQPAVAIGQTHFANDFGGNVEAAEGNLAKQETDGHFAAEQQVEFDFVHHFTPEQWQTYFTAMADDYIPFTADLSAAVEAARATPSATLTLSEHIKATTYRALR
jgi:hypothetical protein